MTAGMTTDDQRHEGGRGTEPGERMTTDDQAMKAVGEPSRENA